ncbi:MAG: adenylate cyclase [Vicingaceae bacterium]|jgi:adenylate cyclase
MREFKRHFRIHFWVALITTAIFLIIRFGILYSYNTVPFEMIHISIIDALWLYPFLTVVISFLTALIHSLSDIFIISKIINRRSFLSLLFTALFVNIVILVGLLFVMNSLIQLILEKFSDQMSVNTNMRELWVSAFFIVVSITLARMVIEIDRKLGPGNLWKFMTGRFYHPREEERIFMFIDLQGSTTIAEKIGHFKFSELLRDCFNDLSIVDKFHAEIYQYVGDEVVISWPVNKAKNYEQFLSAFFAFQDKLAGKKEHYMSTYGLQPVFKAGVHAGPAVVTEVGEIKRELTYHGDTLNTAARIQSMCNELSALLLVSESLYEIVKPYSPHEFKDAGSIALRGKKEEVRLFKVNK